MKKKVFIFSHAMKIGGAERALLGLLSNFDYSKYEIDLFLLQHTGELMPLIPKEVNLLPENKKYSAIMDPMVSVLKQKQIKVLFGRLNGKLHAKKYNEENALANSCVAVEYSHKYTVDYMPDISDKEYDVAISFLTPHYFVRDKVKAKKKIAWIHTDYSTVSIDVKSELKMWSAYDNIISISDDVTNAFLSKFPSLESKIVYIENISSKDFIESQAAMVDVSDEMDSNSVKLLSIGRFSTPKNFNNIPEIASIVKSNGIDFKWYIVGYGDEECLIRSKIEEFAMQDTVIILGKKDNPYPYIKACDIYVQPSLYEGKAVTVHEALILNKPIVITNYPTAHSQLKDGFDGAIVPMENKDCAENLTEFIKNKKLQQYLIKNMQASNYSNEDEIEKLYKLIGE